MKRLAAILIILVLVLSGCQFTVSSSDGSIDVTGNATSGNIDLTVAGSMDSHARAYPHNGGSPLTLQNNIIALGMFDTEIYDIGSEMDTTRETGTTTATEANKLVDTGTDFTTYGVQKYWGVYNTTDLTHGYVWDISEAAIGKLGIASYSGNPINIFTSGEGYVVYAGGRFTASEAGIYICSINMFYQSMQQYDIANVYISKNGSEASAMFQTMNFRAWYSTSGQGMQSVGFVSLDAGDFVIGQIHQSSGGPLDAWYVERYANWSVSRLY